MVDDDGYGAVDLMWIVRETEIFGENLPHCRFVQHKSHVTWARNDPEMLRWEVGD
jgi:hypothetical protein